MLRPLDTPWAARAADVAMVTDRPAVLELLVAGVALLLASWVLRVRPLAAVAVPVLLGSGRTHRARVRRGLPGGAGVSVGLAAALLVAGPLLDARGRVAVGWAALGSAGVLLALTTTWSLAADRATLLVLPAAALALLAGAAAARRSEALRPWRVGQVVTALLLGVAEAAALLRYDGAGWPAVWSLALSLLVLVAAVGRGRGGAAHRGRGPVLGAAALGSRRGGGSGPGRRRRRAGPVLRRGARRLRPGSGRRRGRPARPHRCAGAAPAAGARRPAGRGRPAAAVPALAFAALDGERLWVALLVVGLGVAVVATTPSRHQAGWVAGVVLAGSSWVRLALADVDAPEAYTAPGGVALLVVGALRRRRDPAYGSWQAYGSGLSLVLVPSLLRAVTDAGDLRPLLLALTAAAVLAVGAARRLQAPLVLGGAALGVDALVQLAPYLAAAYDAVPRWVTIGLIGLALVGAGATYEQRVRDLRRVGRHVARSGLTRETRCSGAAASTRDVPRCGYDPSAPGRGRPGDLRTARARAAP